MEKPFLESTIEIFFPFIHYCLYEPNVLNYMWRAKLS